MVTLRRLHSHQRPDAEGLTSGDRASVGQTRGSRGDGHVCAGVPRCVRVDAGYCAAHVCARASLMCVGLEKLDLEGMG